VETEEGKVDGDFRVQGKFTLQGMIKGSVIVDSGGVFHLRGLVSRDLSLEPGSQADLRGLVIGDVVNRGGRLRVFGRISGALRHEAGETLVHPRAVVRGGIVGSTSVLEEPF
jgi:hypothetical protein